MSTTVIGMDASRTVVDVGAEILDVCDRGSGVHSGAELGLTDGCAVRATVQRRGLTVYGG